MAADRVDLPYPDVHFHFIISNAVLHFAENRVHFTRMFNEVVWVLAPGGNLWIPAFLVPAAPPTGSGENQLKGDGVIRIEYVI